MPNVKADFATINKALEKYGISHTVADRIMNHTTGYYNKCARSNSIDSESLQTLLAVLNLDYESICLGKVSRTYEHRELPVDYSAIESARVKAGISKEDLGLRMGKSRAYYNNSVKVNAMLSDANVQALCEILSLSRDTVLGIADTKSTEVAVPVSNVPSNAELLATVAELNNKLDDMGKLMVEVVKLLAQMKTDMNDNADRQEDLLRQFAKALL